MAVVEVHVGAHRSAAKVQPSGHAVAAEEMKHLREAQHIEGPLKWHGYSLPEPAAPFVTFRQPDQLAERPHIVMSHRFSWSMAPQGAGERVGGQSPSQAGAASSKNRLTARHLSNTSHSSSSPARIRASETCWWATTVSRRSAASVAEAKESMADTSTGSSIPVTPARSIANRNRSGPWGNGGMAHVKVSGKWNSSGGSVSSASSTTVS